MTIKAIETKYKGYNFRSRTEARWAVFFDALGLKWEYEPEGFQLESGWYLPDFKVYYPGRCDNERHHQWFECKGDLREVSEADWKRLVEFDTREGLVILDGAPDVRMYLNPRDICSTDFADFIDRPEDLIGVFKAQEHALSHKRSGWVLLCDKGRMWWDDHDNYWINLPDYLMPKVIKAVEAARSARFEFGQKGAK